MRWHGEHAVVRETSVDAGGPRRVAHAHDRDGAVGEVRAAHERVPLHGWRGEVSRGALDDGVEGRVAWLC